MQKTKVIDRYLSPTHNSCLLLLQVQASPEGGRHVRQPVWQLSALQQHSRAVCGRPESTSPAVHRYRLELVGSRCSSVPADHVSNLRSNPTSTPLRKTSSFSNLCVHLSTIKVTASCIFPPVCADTSHTLPPFPSPDLAAHPLPERISMTDIKKLQTLYRDHCEVCPVRAKLSTSAPWKACLNDVSREMSVIIIKTWGSSRLGMLVMVSAENLKC